MSIALTQIVVFEIVWFVLLVPLFDDRVVVTVTGG
jgi:hypothetical protein